jgi:predicted Zn finger-like uncharacterized protein
MIQLYNLQPALKIISVKVNTPALKAQVQARGAGFVAWLLHLLGLGRTYTLAISPVGFRKESSGFGGEDKIYIPRPHASVMNFKMAKPVEYLALGFILLAMGIGAFRLPAIGTYTGLAGIAVAVLLVLIYFLTGKRVILAVVPDSGTHEVSLKLKATGPQLDDLRDVVNVMETLIRSIETHAGGTPGPGRGAGSAEERSEPSSSRQPESRADEAETVECPHCRSRMQITSAHRGKQVRCPSCKEIIQL